jgi:carboxyl-terminal processing protease
MSTMKSQLTRIGLTAVILGAGLISGSLRAIEISNDQAGVISRITTELLSRLHFSNNDLDLERSREFLENYLDSLDPRRMVFLSTDVDQLRENYGDRMFDFIANNRASIAFDIFDKYLRRLEQRVEHAHKLIDSEFDFTINEDLQRDRSEEPWPATDEDAQELWRKRIKDEFLRSRNTKDSDEQIREKLHKRYRTLFNMLSNYDNEEVLQTFLSALGETFDPHSSYMSPTEAKNFEIQNIDLSFFGIGAVLQSLDGYTQIVRLIPGGPAEESKELNPKDRIIAVGQGDEEPVDTVEMKLNKVVDMIRGPRGTTVKLTILPEDDSGQKVVTLVRDKIKLEEQLAKARLIEEVLPSGELLRIGVLDLNQFYDNCSDHLAILIGKLKEKKVDGIVLNLAGNSGGLLPEAQKVAGLFIKSGPIVVVKEVTGNQMTLRDPDPDIVYDGPLVVLTDKMSASASEIVAAALQDHERGIVVGNKTTHGKGTVQTVLDLRRYILSRVIDTPGKLKLTVSKFYRIEGSTTQKDGVTPDIVLPSVLDYMDLGEASLDNALESDRIQSRARYKPFDLVLDYVGTLRQNSEKRVTESQDFAYVMEDINMIREKKEDKTITLNEELRKKEIEENKKRKELRDEERRNRPARKGMVLELTMKDIEDGRDFTAVTEESLLEELRNSGSLDEEEEEEEPFLYVVDPYLEESVQIMADYIGLLREKKKLAGDKSLVMDW